jgi:hypothetical protein
MSWAKGRKSMTIRTTRTTVSFSQPFKLKDLDDLQPAGDYILDTSHRNLYSYYFFGLAVSSAIF